MDERPTICCDVPARIWPGPSQNRRAKKGDQKGIVHKGEDKDEDNNRNYNHHISINHNINHNINSVFSAPAPPPVVSSPRR